MLYYVVAPDGNRYGPADMAALVQWATEGRVQQTTMLEEVNTGRRVPASQVSAIWAAMDLQSRTAGHNPNLPPNPYTASPFQQSFAVPGTGQFYSMQGRQMLIYGWVSAGLGLLLCPVFQLVALGLFVYCLVLAGKATAAGDYGAGRLRNAAALGIAAVVIADVVFGAALRGLGL